MTANVTTPPSPKDAEAIKRVGDKLAQAVNLDRPWTEVMTRDLAPVLALARRTQAAEGERDALKRQFAEWVEAHKQRGQLLAATEADAARMREALEQIASLDCGTKPVREQFLKAGNIAAAALTPPQAPAASASSGEA